MGKTNQDFTTWKGNYRQIVFYIEDVSTVTGGTAEWAMSTTEEATGSQAILKTSGGFGITLSGKNVTVTLEPADTTGITAGSYYHELRLVDTVGQPTTPAIGTVTILPVLLTS